MTTEQALLQAVCDDPEDDSVRLAYSDWLEETGDAENLARAEFIRTQIELAGMPDYYDEDPEMAERRLRLQIRQVELVREGDRRNRWLTPIRPPDNFPRGISRVGFYPGPFVRGFPCFAMGEPGDFLQVGEALFGCYPVHGLYSGINQVSLTSKTAAPFLSAPWLQRVRRMWASAEEAVTDRVFTARALTGLEELWLRGGQFGIPGRRVPARALKSLRKLTLDSSLTRGPADIARLGELLPQRARLTRLSLSLPRLDRAVAAQAIANMEQCRKLEHLSLGVWGSTGVHLGRDGIRALTTAPLWKTLRSLHLCGEGLRDQEALALAEAPPAPILRSLNLCPHWMTRRGVEALAASPLLQAATELDLGCGSGIGDEGAALLAASPHLGRLVALSLAVARLTPRGIKALATAPWAGGIVRLNLRDNQLKKAGVAVLADPANFPRLRRLDLQRAVWTKDLKDKLTRRFGDGVRFVF
jgi:uncharacterized protein (TIGR02996 family)